MCRNTDGTGCLPEALHNVQSRNFTQIGHLIFFVRISDLRPTSGLSISTRKAHTQHCPDRTFGSEPHVRTLYPMRLDQSNKSVESASRISTSKHTPDNRAVPSVCWLFCVAHAPAVLFELSIRMRISPEMCVHRMHPARKHMPSHCMRTYTPL